MDEEPLKHHKVVCAWDISNLCLQRHHSLIIKEAACYSAYHPNHVWECLVAVETCVIGGGRGHRPRKPVPLSVYFRVYKVARRCASNRWDEKVLSVAHSFLWSCTKWTLVLNDGCKISLSRDLHIIHFVPISSVWHQSIIISLSELEVEISVEKEFWHFWPDILFYA